jgi:hypothetical protein
MKLNYGNNAFPTNTNGGVTYAAPSLQNNNNNNLGQNRNLA